MFEAEWAAGVRGIRVACSFSGKSFWNLIYLGWKRRPRNGCRSSSVSFEAFVSSVFFFKWNFVLVFHFIFGSHCMNAWISLIKVIVFVERWRFLFTTKNLPKLEQIWVYQRLLYYQLKTIHDISQEEKSFKIIQDFAFFDSLSKWGNLMTLSVIHPFQSRSRPSASSYLRDTWRKSRQCRRCYRLFQAKWNQKRWVEKQGVTFSKPTLTLIHKDKSLKICHRIFLKQCLRLLQNCG